jgi:hypothetical protein
MGAGWPKTDRLFSSARWAKAKAVVALNWRPGSYRANTAKGGPIGRSRNRPFKNAGHRAMRRVFSSFPSCPYPKSNPEILVMKPAENRPRQNHASSLHCTWTGASLLNDKCARSVSDRIDSTRVH